ncbi:MAG TPA: hypothetical protein VJW23_03860, partial [Propionibacteriaceae bacterium]|nr:hypothetical protein [Propionibacteriaceae bacterium]
MGREAVHRVAAPDAASHTAAMEDAGWVLTSRNDEGGTIVFRWRHDPGGVAKEAAPSPDAVHQKRLDHARGMTAPEGVLQIERRLGKTAGDRHVVNSTSSEIWDHVPRSAERSSGSWMSKSVDFAWDDGRIEEGAVGSAHARVVEARDIAPHRSISISEHPIAGHYSGSVTEHRAHGPAVHEIREGESVATAFRRLASDPPLWIITREQHGEERPDGSWTHTEYGAIYRVFEGPPQRTPGEEQGDRRKREQLLFNN